jgi:hypothetical protein
MEHRFAARVAISSTRASDQLPISAAPLSGRRRSAAMTNNRVPPAPMRVHSGNPPAQSPRTSTPGWAPQADADPGEVGDGEQRLVGERLRRLGQEPRPTALQEVHWSVSTPATTVAMMK